MSTKRFVIIALSAVGILAATGASMSAASAKAVDPCGGWVYWTGSGQWTCDKQFPCQGDCVLYCCACHCEEQ